MAEGTHKMKGQKESLKGSSKTKVGSQRVYLL